MRDFVKSRGKATKVDSREDEDAAISVRYFLANFFTSLLAWKENMLLFWFAGFGFVDEDSMFGMLGLLDSLPLLPSDIGMLYSAAGLSQRGVRWSCLSGRSMKPAVPALDLKRLCSFSSP